ncbi:alpha/beta hydrolase [Micavibrio aeruginosavorus]|uniref:alpha/beta hydrolase n=1 Tax=Micavibrio aeruginosavorus TaxID=349221 RepID=UPI003F4A929F
MNGTDLEYVAHGPKSGQAKKLVVLLHGYGRNAKYMDKMALALCALMPDALVVAPHGPEQLNVPQNIGKHNGDVLHIPQEVLAGNDGNDPAMLRQWFAIDGDLKTLYPRMVNIARVMNEFIDNQRDMLGLTDADIGLMGFSQGGGVALFTGFTRGAELGALVGHSCIFFHDPAMTATPQTLMIHGDNDPEFGTAAYLAAFNAVSAYTKGRATHHVVPGLGHYTSTASRAVIADFIRDQLCP